MKVQKIPSSVVPVQNMEKNGKSGNPELGIKQEKEKRREKREESGKT